MTIFTGALIKSRIGTKSDVVCCGNNCLSYDANNGSLLSARCHRGSVRHNIFERLHRSASRHRDWHNAAHRKGACLKGCAAILLVSELFSYLGARAADATPRRGDFWILKMSFGPCSKNLAEKMSLEPNLSAWSAGAATVSAILIYYVY